MKNKSLNFVRLTFLAFFTFFSISLSAQNSFYSFKPGSVLIYNFTEEFSSVPDQQLKVEVTTDITTIDSKSYYTVNTYLSGTDGFSLFRSSFTRTESNGSIYYCEDENTPESLIFKNGPWKIGDTWQSVVNGKLQQLTIIKLNETLKILGKTFENCLVVDSGDGTYAYFQKDVGLVASSYMINGEEKFMMYLSGSEK